MCRPLANQRNKISLEKWLISCLRQEMYKMSLILWHRIARKLPKSPVQKSSGVNVKSLPLAREGKIIWLVKAVFFPVVMYGCESWTIYIERWAWKNWCFWTVVLEKTLESRLDCKEIKPVNPKGYQPWICIGRTDAEAETWPPDVKSWLIGKDPDAGKDWG